MKAVLLRTFECFGSYRAVPTHAAPGHAHELAVPRGSAPPAQPEDLLHIPGGETGVWASAALHSHLKQYWLGVCSSDGSQILWAANASGALTSSAATSLADILNGEHSVEEVLASVRAWGVWSGRVLVRKEHVTQSNSYAHHASPLISTATNLLNEQHCMATALQQDQTFDLNQHGKHAMPMGGEVEGTLLQSPTSPAVQAVRQAAGDTSLFSTGVSYQSHLSSPHRARGRTTSTSILASVAGSEAMSSFPRPPTLATALTTHSHLMDTSSVGRQPEGSSLMASHCQDAQLLPNTGECMSTAGSPRAKGDAATGHSRACSREQKRGIRFHVQEKPASPSLSDVLRPARREHADTDLVNRSHSVGNMRLNAVFVDLADRLLDSESGDEEDEVFGHSGQLASPDFQSRRVAFDLGTRNDSCELRRVPGRKAPSGEGARKATPRRSSTMANLMLPESVNVENELQAASSVVAAGVGARTRALLQVATQQRSGSLANSPRARRASALALHSPPLCGLQAASASGELCSPRSQPLSGQLAGRSPRIHSMDVQGAGAALAHQLPGELSLPLADFNPAAQHNLVTSSMLLYSNVDPSLPDSAMHGSAATAAVVHKTAAMVDSPGGTAGLPSLSTRLRYGSGCLTAGSGALMQLQSLPRTSDGMQALGTATAAPCSLAGHVLEMQGSCAGMDCPSNTQQLVGCSAQPSSSSSVTMPLATVAGTTCELTCAGLQRAEDVATEASVVASKPVPTSGTATAAAIAAVPVPGTSENKTAMKPLDQPPAGVLAQIWAPKSEHPETASMCQGMHTLMSTLHPRREHPSQEVACAIAALQQPPHTQLSTGDHPSIIAEELQHHEAHSVFEVSVEAISHPATGEQALMVGMRDVTARAAAEAVLAEITESQLAMVAQMFPRHIIEALSSMQGGAASPAAAVAAPPGSAAPGAGAGATAEEMVGQLAMKHDNVTLLFMDISGFTTMCKVLGAQQVMVFLNQLFSKFDHLVEVHGVHKVETAGDCYIVSAGVVAQGADGFMHVVESHDPADSAARVMAFAKDMLAAAQTVAMPHTGEATTVRIGLHTGPCTSGLIGSKLPKFSLFGDTMNTASRMESTAPVGRIQVSETTHALLPREAWQSTGGVEVKGKGVMNTWLWLPTDTTPNSQASAAPPTILHPGAIPSVSSDCHAAVGMHHFLAHQSPSQYTEHGSGSFRSAACTGLQAMAHVAALLTRAPVVGPLAVHHQRSRTPTSSQHCTHGILDDVLATNLSGTGLTDAMHFSSPQCSDRPAAACCVSPMGERGSFSLRPGTGSTLRAAGAAAHPGSSGRPTGNDQAVPGGVPGTSVESVLRLASGRSPGTAHMGAPVVLLGPRALVPALRPPGARASGHHAPPVRMWSGWPTLLPMLPTDVRGAATAGHASGSMLVASAGAAGGSRAAPTSMNSGAGSGGSSLVGGHLTLSAARQQHGQASSRHRMPMRSASQI